MDAFEHKSLPRKYIVRQPFEMRTTFFEMCLLNDASQMCDTSFIQNGDEEGERAR